MNNKNFLQNSKTTFPNSPNFFARFHLVYSFIEEEGRYLFELFLEAGVLEID